MRLPLANSAMITFVRVSKLPTPATMLLNAVSSASNDAASEFVDRPARFNPCIRSPRPFSVKRQFCQMKRPDATMTMPAQRSAKRTRSVCEYLLGCSSSDGNSRAYSATKSRNFSRNLPCSARSPRNRSGLSTRRICCIQLRQMSRARCA